MHCRGGGRRCAPYDSAEYILGGGVKYALAPKTCPLVRATYPVPWMWRASNALLGWTTHDADPRGGNCVQKMQDDWLCSALGSGFVIAEVRSPRPRSIVFFGTHRTPSPQVLLPIFVVFLVWPYVLKPAARTAWKAAVDTLGDVHRLVDAVEERVHTLLGKRISGGGKHTPK